LRDRSPARREQASDSEPPISVAGAAGTGGRGLRARQSGL